MRVLGIDPGTRRTGFAVLDGLEVKGVACAATPSSLKGRDAVLHMVPNLELCMLKLFFEDPTEPDVIVVENQAVHHGTTKNRSRPQDLILLAQVAGAALAYAVYFWDKARVEFPTAHEWKGGVPKTISQARSYSKVGIKYKKTSRYTYPTDPPEWANGIKKAEWAEIGDAIGLAIYGQSL